LHLIVETYYQLYPHTRDRERVLFLLDEIQRVSGWETFVRRLLDSETVAVFLSGSSARMLAYELGTQACAGAHCLSWCSRSVSASTCAT
jgi:predicted AAA+ superfamily ATPase